MIRQTKNNLIFIMKCIQTEKQTQAFHNIVEEKNGAITRIECVIKVQMVDVKQKKNEQLMKFTFFSLASWKSVVRNLITLKIKCTN